LGSYSFNPILFCELSPNFTSSSNGFQNFFKTGWYDKDRINYPATGISTTGVYEMKKFLIALTVLVALVAVFATTGPVSAQGTNPPATPGAGMMNGRGGRGAASGGIAAGNGILHDAMLAVYAEKLGLSVEQINTRLTNGETMGQIAAAQGVTAEEFFSIMADARSQAIDLAVADGTLAQAQADWMKERGSMRSGEAVRGRGGMRGGFAGNADCPYFPKNTP
jgi:hypothetical protein